MMNKIFNNTYKGKRVLVTGNTGFKGSWLTLWLKTLGAEVAGFSNGIPTNPSNYEISCLNKKIKQYNFDIRDYNSVLKTFNSFKPDFVFHLAAQSLVRTSLKEPLETFNTNIMGTANILEAIRKSPKKITGIIITSDKCYRNKDWVWGYRESDELGGDDPYSASKGGAELVCRSYSNIYDLEIATTRAGNVIGGGDFAEDRIVPDCVRAWGNKKIPLIRQPNATRPWQYVLEPLGGYLWLGSSLFENPEKFKGTSYNFGSNAEENYSVRELLKVFKNYWPNIKWRELKNNKKAQFEAKLLKLNCDKAFFDLKWKTILTLDRAVDMTSKWYLNYLDKKEDMYNFSVFQIEEYLKIAKEENVPWIK